MGTPEWLQRSVLIVNGAVPFVAEKAVLKGMFVGDVGAVVGFEDGELVCGIGCRAKEAAEEGLQDGLEWVSDIWSVVVAFICSSWWRR